LSASFNRRDRALAETSGQASNDDIKKVIAEGKGKMKPVKTVNGEAVDDVAAYVHSLKK